MMSASQNVEFTPEFLIKALQLKMPLPQDATVPFQGIVTDSRKIRPGCLFVALKGDQFDGHDFIESAISQGARGIFCRSSYPKTDSSGVTFYQVSDPLEGYRTLGGAWRRLFSLPVIVVAGSAGKTTTKEL